ncbi:MAG: hypothetical protein WD314_04815, partial [Trueperaceae bacterium]
MLTSCLELSGGPRIQEFKADPDTVAAGETVKLSWQVDGLDGGNLTLQAIEEGSGSNSVQLGDVTRQRSMAVRAERTTTYRLVASTPSGQSSKDARVSVIGDGGRGPDGSPIVDYFRAPDQQDAVEPGQSVRLEWAVQNAQQVMLDPPGMRVDASGSIDVEPYVTTTYVLSATN